MPPQDDTKAYEPVPCPKCGHDNRPSAKHCTKCGRPLAKEVPPPKPMRAEPEPRVAMPRRPEPGDKIKSAIFPLLLVLGLIFVAIGVPLFIAGFTLGQFTPGLLIIGVVMVLLAFLIGRE